MIGRRLRIPAGMDCEDRRARIVGETDTHWVCRVDDPGEGCDGELVAIAKAYLEGLDIHTGLKAARERRQAAEAERAEAMEETARWLRRGVEHGSSISTLAESAGLTRQTVYDILGRDPGR